MRGYRVEIDMHLARRIKKLDRQVRLLLDSYIKTHLAGATDPGKYGRPLAGGLKGLWRYGIGDWRLIVQIVVEKLLILALEFAGRGSVYRDKG